MMHEMINLEGISVQNQAEHMRQLYPLIKKRFKMGLKIIVSYTFIFGVDPLDDKSSNEMEIIFIVDAIEHLTEDGYESISLKNNEHALHIGIDMKNNEVMFTGKGNNSPIAKSLINPSVTYISA